MCIYIAVWRTDVKVDASASFCILALMTQPSPQTIAVWTSLVSANRDLLDEIEKALKKEGLPKLNWYDALLEIEKADATGIRPLELKDRLLLPQYGTSRLLERIAKAGLIERLNVEEDGRGQIIRLTQKGRKTREAMWPVYAGVLTRSVEQYFSHAEAKELARLLGKLMLHRSAEERCSSFSERT
jgi:DNA-binding MarR family transcriptional regulator